MWSLGCAKAGHGICGLLELPEHQKFVKHEYNSLLGCFLLCRFWAIMFLLLGPSYKFWAITGLKVVQVAIPPGL